MKASKLFVTVLFILFSLSLSTSASSAKKQTDPIEICSNLSGMIRILASERDAGIDYHKSKTASDLKQLEPSSNISVTDILTLVKQTNNLKSNVLSNAFGNACLSSDQSRTLNTDYYKGFEVCNAYTENEELVFKCVTNVIN